MKTSHKRSIVLIDHRFQLRMAAAFIALQVLLTGVFAFALYLFMDSEIHADLASAHASYQSLSQMLTPIVVILAVFSVTLSVVLSTIFVVMLSHKIAGPMYRFRAVLEAMAERKLESFRSIRPDDQLGEVAASLDKVVKVLREDLQMVRNEVRNARLELETGQVNALSTRLDALDQTLGRWDGVHDNP